MTMRARETTHLSLLLAAVALAGCSFSASYSGRWYTGKPDPIRVPSPPPESDRREQPKECKGPKLWVFGYWDWKSAKWQWTAGSCKKPPEQGAEWVGPVLYEVEGGYELVPGHWAPPRREQGSGGEADDNGGRGAGVGISAGGSVGTGGKKPGKGGKKPAAGAGAGAASGGDSNKPGDSAEGSAGGAASAGGGAAAGGASRPASSRPEKPGAPAAGGRATAGAGGGGMAKPADKQPGKPAGSRPQKPVKPVAGGAGGAAGAAGATRPDRSNQEGMAVAKDAVCRVAEDTVEPGKALVIEVEGLNGRPKVRFGKATVRILKITDSTIRVRVPKGLARRPAMVSLQYGKTRLTCGKVRPAGPPPGKADRSGKSRRSSDVGSRETKADDRRRPSGSGELKKKK